MTYQYKPLDIFKPYHERTQRFAVVVGHRRSGKTIASMNDLIDRAMNCEPNDIGIYAYVAAQSTQIRLFAWPLMYKFTKDIPGVEFDEDNLTINLPNGSTIRLFSSERIDHFTNLQFKAAVFDDFGHFNQFAFHYLLPTIQYSPKPNAKEVYVTFIGFPVSKFGSSELGIFSEFHINDFYAMYLKAKTNPDWLLLDFKASQSGVISPKELAFIRSNYNDATEFNKQFECEFSDD